VIVLGNQKSGTSAIASLLADLCGLTKTIDIPALWGERAFAVMSGERTLAQAIEEDPRPFRSELIKEPSMTFFADQVVEAFPTARLVFVVRDPRDNARSLLNRRGLPGDLEQLTDELRASLGKRVTVDPRVWGGEGENYVGVLAHRWNLAVDNYSAHAARTRLAKYEDFVDDKLGFLRSLAADLDLEPVADVSGKLDRQYQPAGDRGVTWSDFFGASNLERIERICGERMARLGYAR
jgi:hypothetical protein